jgi:hypothetical protein
MQTVHAMLRVVASRLICFCALLTRYRRLRQLQSLRAPALSTTSSTQSPSFASSALPLHISFSCELSLSPINLRTQYFHSSSLHVVALSCSAVMPPSGTRWVFLPLLHS